MSILKNKGKTQDAVRRFVDEVRSSINTQGNDFTSPEQTRALISLESLNDRELGNLDSHLTSISASLKDTIAKLGLEAFNETTTDGKRALEIGLQAGAIVAAAHGDPVAYAQKALSMESGSVPANTTVIDSIGQADYRDRVALEAFDDRVLNEFLAYSVAFNVFASRQDEFSEKFYPTVVGTPDQTGIDVSVSRVRVFNEVKHAITGKAMDFGKRNLIDAAVDHTILADESTRLVPYRNPDDSTAAYFIDEDVVGARAVKIAGIDVPTAPLAMGVDIGLLGLSQYQPLIGAGVYTESDAIDAKISVDAVYLQLADNAPGIAFSTVGKPRSQFVKSPEGRSREMVLQFNVRDLIIDKDTRAVDGSVITALAAVASNSWTVRLGSNIAGTIDVEYGNVNVFATPLKVISIHDAAGAEVSTATGPGATLRATLEGYSLTGYDIGANRTNSNRRTRGLLLTTDTEVERYTIPLGAPISVPAPATNQDDASDLKALIAAARRRNSNNAVGQLFRYADQLEAYVKGPRIINDTAGVQGMGRHLVKPFFERHVLDLTKSINTRASHEKAADISSVLVNAIREVAYRAYRDSRLQAAYDQATGGSGEKPVLVVGTDQVLIRHLMVEGDTRTFGTAFDDAEVVHTLDNRMDNKIVLTFTRKKNDGADPLTFGTHAWIPELTSTMPVNRSGATIKETMVQPRSLHFNNLPVLAIIEVEGLSEVLVDKIAEATEANDVGNPFLDGITP